MSGFEMVLAMVYAAYTGIIGLGIVLEFTPLVVFGVALATITQSFLMIAYVL